MVLQGYINYMLSSWGKDTHESNPQTKTMHLNVLQKLKKIKKLHTFRDNLFEEISCTSPE